jgi:hypothetical protein
MQKLQLLWMNLKNYLGKYSRVFFIDYSRTILLLKEIGVDLAWFLGYFTGRLVDNVPFVAMLLTHMEKGFLNGRASIELCMSSMRACE